MGGDWPKNIDRPHFEIKTSWKAPASDSVKELQQLLNRIGYKLDVDGLYGPATTNAIKAFQKANSLTVDGSAGPATMAALELATKPAPPVAVTPPKEDTKMPLLLNDTGRVEAKQLIKKAVAAGIFKESHLSKLDSYTDADLISYSIAYVNRTAK
ncbi:peptidoglycan-binding protein [Sporosarcina sp. FSL K6-1522]|uniref:peptidoglycan-binding domain-containing protein n=1 Tax=Sporosarcina sp. FSL K6-1522 TaxID=2921554 RepID=UPI00315A2106